MAKDGALDVVETSSLRSHANNGAREELSIEFLKEFEKHTDGPTAIFRAGLNGELDVVKRLVAAGGNVKEKDNNGNSLLHGAAHANSGEMISYLFNKGLNLNDVNKEGRTALHIAMHEGNEAAAKVLLQLGADPNVRDKNGRTAAMEYVDRPTHPSGPNVMLKMLDDRGADFSIKDNAGNDALSIANTKRELDHDIKILNDRSCERNSSVKCKIRDVLYDIGWKPIADAIVID